MIAFLQHCLAASYLFSQEMTPLRTWSAAETRGAVLLVPGMLLAWRWGASLRASGRAPLPAWITGLGFLATLFLLAVRFQVRGPLSPRIWWLSAVTVGLLTPPIYWLSRRPLGPGMRAVGRALACRLGAADPPLSPLWQLGLTAAHLGGLLLLSRHPELGAWPWLSAGAALGAAALGEPGAGSTASWRARFRPELLSPLFMPHLAGFLHGLVAQRLGVDVAPYGAFPYPNLWSPWFDLRIPTAAALAWLWLGVVTYLSRSRARTGLEGSALGGALLLASLGWYALTTARHLSHGITGSDPFCYAQMAMDLVEHGAPLHAFPLAEMAREVGIPVWPTVHVGYHPPTHGVWAPTVWPIGWPALMALFYWLGGERGLLWAAPAFALLAALLSRRLAQALAPQDGALVGGLMAFVLVTSPESVLRSLVPMADAAAQALSVLAVLMMLHASRRDALRWSALAGASLAWAYTVRHPQVFVALGLGPALLLAPWPWRRRLQHLCCFLGAALLAAAPDIAYRTLTFGALWAVESPEWHLFSWRHAWSTLSDVLQAGWFQAREFGYLLPAAVYGLYHQFRADRRSAAVLATSCVASLGFQLCYSALRFRDLIPLFPWVAFWAAYGVAALWRLATAPPGGSATGRRILVLALATMALASRTVGTLHMPLSGAVWTFGYVSVSQRAEYARLAETLPSNAIVATGLSSGSVARYTGRPTVRPAAWGGDEFRQFVGATAESGYILYLLDDGEEMAAFIAPLADGRAAVRVGSYGLPRFGRGGQPATGESPLYRLEERAAPASAAPGSDASEKCDFCRIQATASSFILTAE